MTWYERIVSVHTAVTPNVSHYDQMQSDRYFVWQEDGANDFEADDLHAESAVTGTTDLYTKQEFDPWKDAFEAALEADGTIAWSLNSVQYEEDTGFIHYEWEWQLPKGTQDG